MSDVEEPPTKMSKYEEYLEEEGEDCMGDGQEEWLSEGVLTDDDYNPASEQDNSQQSLNTTQEDAFQTVQGVIKNENAHIKSEPNIEETLTTLDSTKNGDELPDDLDAFLIRKTDGKVVETKIEANEIKIQKQSEEDDGNDTDDLLRMLGEGDQRVKVQKKSIKLVKAEKTEDQDSSDDDDEFIYERSKVKTLKLAKNALIKRVPAVKAEPEDMSDGDDETDQSSDEGSTVQRMFGMKKKGLARTEPPPKKIVKHVAQVNTSFNKSEKPGQKVNKPLAVQKPVLKPALPKLLPKPNLKSVEIKTPSPFKPLDKNPVLNLDKVKSEMKTEFDEIIDEEEFLEEDDIDLDEEEFGEESEGEESKKQKIMRPERMDEEVPSDAESHSEDGSLYDELPSSDSDDLDDWFSLDIRAERAGDYLPLLGTKARELLLAERRRVSGRVSTLRQSLSALTDSARRQADQLRSAAMALAEIDDTLRAA